jgi:hypothetical protein
MTTILRRAACVILPVAILPLAGAQTVVFADNFDGPMPAAISPGVAALEGVQGYAGLGPAGNQFGATFLRSPTGNVVTLQLGGLPPHNAVSVDFLFAAIDSLDGSGSFPSGDYFKVTLDGNPFFRESFANALPTQIQSYVSPPGVELARHIDLGFSGPGGYYTDSAYWLGGDPLFQNIGHSASSLTLTFEIEGPGIQGLGDESWAIDNLRISVATVINPGSATAYGTSCGPLLSATSAPRIGRPLPLLLLNLPASSALACLAAGWSDVSCSAGPLPLSLAPHGMPGCWLLQDLALATSLPMNLYPGAAGATIAIPANAAYSGVRLFLQSWVLAPGSNALGIVFSNGLRVQVGQ